MKKTVALFSLLIISLFCSAQKKELAIAENYFKNNEYEKAIQLYTKLYAKSDKNVTVLKRLISCYQETEQFNVAEDFLTKKLAKKPKLTYLNVLIGNNFERQQKTEKALIYYKKAIASINKKANYGAKIAKLLKEYNQLDLAIESYEKTMEQNPSSNYRFQLAQIYGEKGDFERMFESYVNLVDKNKRYLNTVKRFTSKYIDDDSENENNILFKKALLRKSISKPKNIWNNLLSWLFIRQKEYNKALIQNKALLARDVDNLSKIGDLGNISFNNKDYETAKKCFDIVIEKTNYPSDKFDAINNNLKIAIATKQTDIKEQFNAVFTKYGINQNTFLIQLNYADYLTFTVNNATEAIKVLENSMEFANSKFSKAMAKLKLGEVLVYTGKFNTALISFSQVQTTFKNHFLGQQARFKVAQTSYFKNDFSWAKAQLKVLKGSATQLIANDAADLFLTISDNQRKDSVATGLKDFAKAELLAFQNKNDAAITILSDILTTYKGQPIEDEALYKQAKLFVKNEKFEDAISNFNKIIELSNDEIYKDDAYYYMAEIYNTKLNSKEKAQEYYQKIIFDHPSSIYLVDARKKYRKLRGDQIN